MSVGPSRRTTPVTGKSVPGMDARSKPNTNLSTISESTQERNRFLVRFRDAEKCSREARIWRFIKEHIQVKSRSSVNLMDVIVDLQTARTGRSTVTCTRVTSLTTAKLEAVTKVTHTLVPSESTWKSTGTSPRAWKRKIPTTVILTVKPLPLVRHYQNPFILRSRPITPEPEVHSRSNSSSKLRPFPQCRARPCHTK